ncbi:MAG: Galactokinase [uncultured Thermomicrobiales bacterium]|uniref:Galactokinase n=1 Tax=uncultured Thermomicrobiales bacterium TaxID=1645740 RepID=A0A6J4UC11_9BACT|nr:MAG: Galactokinase [uncultured Thermomicrobiales bacterium]
MSVASSAHGDLHDDRLAPLAIEVLAVGRRSWGGGWTPALRVVAPGRIELLGNHLDYNGGRVLAAAIDRYILLLGEPGAAGGTIEVSYTDPESREHAHESLAVADLEGWQRSSPPDTPTDYLRGAVAALHAEGVRIRPAWRLAIGGNVPVGLGVSSSAALSVGLVMQLSTDPLDPRETILLAQAAENRAGVASGTMDQAASVAGGVIRYDAEAVAFEQLRPDLGDLAFLVVSSGVVHRLGESAYPIRVREMAELLAIARRELGNDAPEIVAGITAEQVDRLVAAGAIDDTLRGRARHIVSEVERVATGYDALNAGDWRRFGQLMSESGRSSASDYDVSHPQVEELVAEITGQPGVLGARMMGGGGGGSVLALVQRTEIDRLAAHLDANYFARYDMSAASDRLLVCGSSEGARSEVVGEQV